MLSLFSRNPAFAALIAAGGLIEEPEPGCISCYENVEWPIPSQLRLDFVRRRAYQICVAMQTINLDALCKCEILAHSFGALGSLIAFHHWWAIATTVKHFKADDV